ncbi:MAG: Ppx/GppA family phosphatase [Rhodospirillaceae bacterium]|nr:Ppx/GppA family phosphatase [Rhodospirillaceae bacterium]
MANSETLSVLAATSGERVGVVDVGSNSIRLVVFDRASRVPVPVFNEKVLCGLARGMAQSGRLNPDGVSLALQSIARFVTLARAMGLARLEAFATAAVRGAEDGPHFVAEVRRRFDLDIVVLDGMEEARLSALGVIADMPEADGVMGDLGGGSLELVLVGDGAPGASVTLPIGPLNLQETGAGDLDAASRIIREHIASVDWLPRLAGRNFYPVGGAWRALARIHMAQTNYPLHVVDHYAVKRSKIENVTDLVCRMSRKSLEKLAGVPRKRLDTLPLAAVLLREVLAVGKPKRLVFSAFGLREGYVFDRVPEDQRAEDPLLVACRDLAARNRRFAVIGEEIFAWSAPLFASEGEEAARDRRLRHASCLLGDIAWGDHPDYRAVQALSRILRLSVLSIDHPGRAFLALATYHRYAGGRDDKEASVARSLTDEGAHARARTLGLVQRLGYSLSGGAPNLLSKCGLALDDNRLVLELPDELADLYGEVAERLFQAVAGAMDRKPLVLTGEPERARTG